MRYLVMYKPEKVGVPPTQGQMAEMGRLVDEGMKSGALVATGGLHPSGKDARVRLSGGKLTVIDGPFTESKELIGGFAIIQAKSREEAIQMTKDFLKIAGDGESVMHLVMDGPPDLQ